MQKCRLLLLASGHVHRTKKGKIAAKLQAVKNNRFSLVYIHLSAFSKHPHEVFLLLFLFSCRTEGALVRKSVSRIIIMAATLMVTPAEAAREDQSEGRGDD